MRPNEQQLTNFYARSRVLVTGGAGAIGSNLVRALLNAGAEVVVVDDLSSGHLWNLPDSPSLLFVEGDIVDETVLKRVFWEKPSVVFHLAAFFANQNSVDFPERDLRVNALGTLRLLEYASLVDIDRFVFASSSSIYGSEPPIPVEESYTSSDLTTPYQMTKMLGEHYSQFFAAQRGVPTVRARFFNAYGPGEVPGQYRNVIPNFIYWSLLGKPLPITGDGSESRDFTFVGDTVNGLLRCGMVDAAIGGAFNLAAGTEVTILDVARRVLAATESESPVVNAGRRGWDHKRRFRAATSKSERILGFEATTSMDDGIPVAVEWFRANWERIQLAASFTPGASSSVRRVDPDKRLL